MLPFSMELTDIWHHAAYTPFFTQSNLSEAGSALSRSLENPLVINNVTGVVWIGILVLLLTHLFIFLWIKHDHFIRFGKKIDIIYIITTFWAGTISLIIYLIKRPTGRPVLCIRCGKAKLEDAPACPHCGTETKFVVIDKPRRFERELKNEVLKNE